MQKQNVETIIKEIATQFFSDANNIDCSRFETANGYFDNRTEPEIERDAKLGIEFLHYMQWVQSAYESLYGKIDLPIETQSEIIEGIEGHNE